MGNGWCKCKQEVTNCNVNLEEPENQIPFMSGADKSNLKVNYYKNKSLLKTTEKESEKTRIPITFDKSMFVRMKKKQFYAEYDIKEKLGEGAYGCVYKVQHKHIGEYRAVKAIKRKHVDGNAFVNEIEILKTVDHPNIIKLFDCFYDNNYYYMVEEYCSHGDLYEYIRQLKFFSEKKAAQILFQLLSAINYLHQKKIVHRDLKPENIVFITTKEKDNYQSNEDIYIKIIDFGTSAYLKKDKHFTQELGTIYYIAPEVFKNKYNEKADIWSIGIILYVMLCGHPPFMGKREEEIKEKILNRPIQFLPRDFNKVSDEAIHLIKQLLIYDPNQRISAAEALTNEWLNKTLKSNKKEDNILQADILENLSKFSSAVTLQKATLSFLANQVSINEEIKKLKDEFEKIDADKNGEISKEELIQCYNKLYGIEEAEKKATEVLKEIDFNNDGSINFSEFITVRMKKDQLCSEDNLKKAFKLFDLDGNGYITLEELKETIPLNIQDNNQWIHIIKEVDKNNDAKIDFNEFKDMMMKLACL